MRVNGFHDDVVHHPQSPSAILLERLNILQIFLQLLGSHLLLCRIRLLHRYHLIIHGNDVLHLLHIGRNDTLASSQPRKHTLPVARLVGQAELAVVTYVVDDHAHLILVVMVDTQPAPHHLQVLGKRQRRAGHLDKLHVRTVKALVEEVHVHQTVYLAAPESLHHLLAHLGRRLAVQRHAFHTEGIVACGYRLGMHNVNGIYDTLLSVGMLHYALIQSLDGLRHIQFLIHLLDGIVAIAASSFQLVHGHLVVGVLADYHIVIRCQITTQDEVVGTRIFQQHLEHPAKGFLVHAAWGGSHAEFQSLPVPVKQILIGVSNGVVRLIHDDESRRTSSPFEFVDMSVQPLNGEHSYPYFRFHLHFLLPIDQTESVERLLHLFHQFTAVRHNPHFVRVMVIKKPFHHRRHHVGFSRTGRHLHHHRAANPLLFPILIIECTGRIGGQHVDNVLQHLLLVIK